ncbi:MAG: GFA family protein [Pseudomonadota bacterium]|nr:GFA family protein [Pseudomonadota bacterium]
MITGSCNCGGVAFEIDAETDSIYCCHCSICQKWSGARGVAVIVFPTSAFKWIKGGSLITHWKKPDADWESWFCSTCGSPLPGKNGEESMFAPAGLITSGGENLNVAHHIFVGSKAHWDVIGDDGQQHDGHIK